jgi:hypothetical protein
MVIDTTVALRIRLDQPLVICDTSQEISDTALKGFNMGFLGRISATVVSPEMVSVVGALIHQCGGVQGIVAQMESQERGNIIKSWVGPVPISRCRPIKCARRLAAKR